jgi:Ca2+-transporting ATPase
MEFGLSQRVAAERLLIEGFNDLPQGKRRGFWVLLLEILREPMVFLLLACGLIYFLLGDRSEALFLMGFLILMVGITLIQNQRAEHALESLRSLSSPRAVVIREGEAIRISGREVVRGDLMLVSEGDRIAADGVLQGKSLLSVDESLITGESVPVSKSEVATQVFAGTTVVSGQGFIQVNSIGMNTEMGKIGKSLEFQTRVTSRLQKETRSWVSRLVWISGSLCLLVILIEGGFRGQLINGLLLGLSLAMAILPNEIPAVLTIFFSLGAARMSKKNVLTRRISAIESLGSATVLCVDKTGTLTLNQMQVQSLWSGGSRLEFQFDLESEVPEEFHPLLEYGIMACRAAPFDPMDRAIHSIGEKYLQQTEHLHQDWILKREYPLSSELMATSHAWIPDESADRCSVAAKGAPEAILDLCHLDEATREKTVQAVKVFADQGLRVLGVAKGFHDSEALPEKQHDISFEFLGLVGLSDPLRPGVREAVEECTQAGVRVVMLTGDHPETAKRIAEQVGLKNPMEVVSGAELEKMTKQAFMDCVREKNVFSRMTPQLKLKLVEAFQSQGEIVAMTGDGVNDVPALKKADIGIAMGLRGSDVARESAALVLLDDDFASIVEALRMGRRIYFNLKNAFLYLLAIHIPIAGISILPVIMGMPIILLPIHIAFLHLVIEPACSMVFESEAPHPELMKRPPRSSSDLFLGGSGDLISCIVSGFLILIALIVIDLVVMGRGGGDLEARALCFATLMIANLLLVRNRTVVLGTLLLMSLVFYVPNLREWFRFSFLHLWDVFWCALIGGTSVLGVNIFTSLGKHWKVRKVK